MTPRRRNPKRLSAEKAQAKMTAFIDRVLKMIEASGPAPQGRQHIARHVSAGKRSI
jgi:hypothetical protein